MDTVASFSNSEANGGELTGVSAQFLAVLETLADHKGRALTRCPPRVTDLDEDTITDLFEELLQCREWSSAECTQSDWGTGVLYSTHATSKGMYTINSLKLITSWRVIKRK